MKAIVRVTLVNPNPTQSYCEADGVRRYYVNWEFPPQITSAIGMGASGRNFGAFAGDPAPVAVCEDRGDHLVCFNVEYR